MPWISANGREQNASEQNSGKSDARKEQNNKPRAFFRLNSTMELLHSHRPEALRLFKKWDHQIRHCESELSLLQREMIATVVSRSNECLYCTINHGKHVKKLTKDSSLYKQLVQDFRQARLSEQDRAMLEFAWKLSLHPQKMGPEDIASLKRHGFSDAAIVDIVLNVALLSAVNRMLKAVGEEVSDKKIEEARRLGIGIPDYLSPESRQKVSPQS